MSDKKPYGKVLIKAVQILDYLSQQPESKSLTDISEMTEITLSTAHKVLDTLELIGFVTRHETKKTYSLGPRLIQIANASFIQFDFVRDTYPALKHLFERVDATVNLGMLQDNEMLYVNKFSKRSSTYDSMSRIGFTQDLYCSAMGKSILANMSEEEREMYIESIELIPKTELTIIDKEVLRDEVERAKKLGYAIDNREAEDKVYCVGTVINNKFTDASYAFSISISYDDYSKEYHDKLIDEIMRTKAVIEYQIYESQPK